MGMIRDQVLGNGMVSRVAARPRGQRIGVVLAALIAGLVVLAIVAVAAYEIAYGNRVYPGVHVAGHDLSGLGEADVRASLATLDPGGAPVAVRSEDGQHSWTLSRADLGLSVDADAVVQAALAYGRSGNLLTDLGAQWAARANGVALDVATLIDPNAVSRVVTRLAGDVDRAAVAGRLDVQGNDAVVVPGEAGVALDRDLATRLLRAVLSGPPMGVPLVLPTEAVAPPVDAAQLEASRAQALALASRPITVHIADRDTTLTLAAADLQKALIWTSNGPTAASAHLDRAKVAALLAPLADQVRLAPQNAQLKLVKGKPTLLPDISGWALDLDGATTAVLAAAETPERSVTLPLEAVPAAVSLADAQPVYTQWNALLSGGFTFHYQDQKWTIKGTKLAGCLSLAGNQGGGSGPYRLQLDTKLLTERITAIADDVNVSPRNARYRLVDGTVTVVAPSRDGQQLDEAATLATAQAALSAGQTAADLVVVTQPAPVSSAQVPATVNTPDLLGTAQTSYVGSSPERAHNVEFGTSLVDGALVAPGQEFDTNATLGPLTLAAGFQMGWGIVSDGSSVTTVPAEAGGICQVATTLFQSVFWAGLPVTERNHHSYWIGSYGRPPSGLQGLDATIAPPEKNFRWVNSTGQWILIKAHAAKGTVRFELWGTNPGWKVQVDGPVITNVVRTSYAPIYEQSWSIPWGVTRLVEHAQNGFTADIHRQVFDATGKQIDDWHAQGTYLPAHDRYVVGQKGRPAPKPKPVAPTATPDPGTPAPPPAAPAAPDNGGQPPPTDVPSTVPPP